jgi:hypothetical protein
MVNHFAICARIYTFVRRPAHLWLTLRRGSQAKDVNNLRPILHLEMSSLLPWKVKQVSLFDRIQAPARTGYGIPSPVGADANAVQVAAAVTRKETAGRSFVEATGPPGMSSAPFRPAEQHQIDS